MALFKDVIKAIPKVQCDNCKEVFESKNIKLVDPSKNINIITTVMSFVFVNKDGEVTGGSQMPTKELGDKVLSCPLCGKIHLYGMRRS